jgi:hypothetical protein
MRVARRLSRASSEIALDQLRPVRDRRWDWREHWRERPLDRVKKPNAARLLIRGSQVRILPGALGK